jgi:uncharacterized membrane protein
MDLSLHLLRDTLWDLFLGVMPVLLGWALAALIRHAGGRWWLWAPMAVIWLLFLPNACYLLTEIRHYLENNPFEILEDSTGHRRIVRFLFWTGFYLFFSGSGLLLFALAIRPVAQALREKGVPGLLLFPPLFFGSAIGVYLGLRLRFNSWDLLTHPEVVWESAVEALSGVAAIYVVAFALFLALAYLALDIWFDGLILRWTRVRERWTTRAN